MRAFVAIFAREFRLRRTLLIGALAIGFIGPVFLGLSGQIAADSVSAVALLIGLLTCATYALVLGSGAIARDLVDGRLGFDFLRPISGFSIWAGRIGAAVALLAVSAVLVVTPALLFYPAPRLLPTQMVWSAAMDSTAGALAVGLLACLALLLLTHVVTVLYASRSAALVLDLAGLVAVGLLVNAALTRLYRNWVQDVLRGGAGYLFAFVLLVLIGASLAQLLSGRTDLARNHRALSMALWIPLLLGALALEAASRWVVSPDLSDLVRNAYVSQAPSGTWFAVAGDLRRRGGLEGHFLVDAVTGRVVRQGVSASNLPFPAAFSNDGKSVAWIAWLPRGTEIRWADLSASKPGVETAPISVEGFAKEPSLSPSGRWLAFRSNGRMLVFELRTGHLVHSARINPDWEAPRIRWIAEDRLRFWISEWNATGGEARISIGEIQIQRDLGNGAPVSVGKIPPSVHGYYAWEVSRDGATVLVPEAMTGRLRLFDGRTGEALGEIHEAPGSDGILLADGSVAVQVHGPESWDLVIYDRYGALRRRFKLRGNGGLWFGAQPTPTTILASSIAEGTQFVPSATRLFLLDLATGGIREVGQGFIRSPETTTSGVTVVRTGPVAFARWDPKTESLKPIFPR